MLGNEGDITAYGGFEDQNLLFNFERISILERVKETERLISKDVEVFKTFVKYVKQMYDKTLLDITPNDLLQINTDKFLEDGIVEYLDNNLSNPFDVNNKTKELKSENYSKLSLKTSK